MHHRIRRIERTLRYGVCDLLSLPSVRMLDAIKALKIDEASLADVYARSTLQDRANDFVLYRIIGNDLPPRHARGQSLQNLRFILDHEADFEGCQKRFVVNRIIDPEVEAQIIDLLEARSAPYLHIPFEPQAYASIELDLDCLPSRAFLSSNRFKRHSPRHQARLIAAVNRHRNNYVMHNNGARNAALEEGKSLAKWVLPFDGNCFFTEAAWAELSVCITERPYFKYFVCPMARIQSNEDLFRSDFKPVAEEEPQLVFRSDASEAFNEAFPYGRFPKIEMFWRLGIPGQWSRVTEKSWDPPRRLLSPEARQFALAGWVARLFSGVAHLEQDLVKGPSNRGIARREAINQLFSRLDLEIHGEDLCAKLLAGGH